MAAQQIKRSTLEAIFAAVGYPPATVAGWDDAKMQVQLKALPQSVEADFSHDDKKLQQAVVKLSKEVEGGKEFLIMTDAKAATPATPVAEAPPKKAAAPKKGAKAAPAAAEAAPATDTPATPATTPGGGVKKTPAPKPEKPARTTGPGVRETRSRPYLAGIVIRKHAGDRTMAKLLGVGVTDAMIAELDEAYGKANPNESAFCLRNAWHSIRGYTGTNNDGDLAPNTSAAE